MPGQAGVVKEVSGDGIRGQEAPGVRDDDVPSVIMLPVTGQLLVAQHEGDSQGQAHATHCKYKEENVRKGKRILTVHVYIPSPPPSPKSTKMPEVMPPMIPPYSMKLAT